MIEKITVKGEPVAKARLKRVAQNAALVLGSMLVSILVLEVLVRLLLPQQLIVLSPEIWRTDSLTGWRRRANVDTRINWGEGMVRLVTDEDGYRINPGGAGSRVPADFMILTLGDSFLEALQVDNEKTLPQVMRTLLEHRHGISVDVDNSSCGDWNPNIYYMEATRALAKRSYDLGFVFLFAGNDIVNKEVDSIAQRTPRARHSLHFPRRLNRTEIIDAVFYPINDVLERTSHLFILLRNSSSIIRAKFGLVPYYFPPEFKITELSSPRWDVTTSICQKIQGLFAKHGTPVVFVLLPAVYQVDEKRFQDYLRMFDIDPDSVNLLQPNQQLGHRFIAAGLRLIDPVDHLREKAANGVKLYGSVDVHFNEAGHRIMAEYLLPVLEVHLPAQREQ